MSADDEWPSAYSVFRFLDSTWAATGYEKTSDPEIQTRAGMDYIKARYGGPIHTSAFWQATHWYDHKGDWTAPEQDEDD